MHARVSPTTSRMACGLREDRGLSDVMGVTVAVWVKGALTEKIGHNVHYRIVGWELDEAVAGFRLTCRIE